MSKFGFWIFLVGSVPNQTVKGQKEEKLPKGHLEEAARGRCSAVICDCLLVSMRYFSAVICEHSSQEGHFVGCPNRKGSIQEAVMVV